VQAVRAAAARVKCANNLKQLGLALHNYHDTQSALPSGLSPRRAAEPYPLMTWLTRLLPYVEQERLWQATVNAYGYRRNPFTNPPHLGYSMPIALFACPADGRVLSPQTTHANRRVALTSYVGVLGIDWARPDGVLYLDSHVRLTDITDGTSNTVMVGERPPSADKWYGWWYAGYGQAGTGSGDMLLGAAERNRGGRYVRQCPPGPYRFGPGKVAEQCDLFHFWSPHPGGAYFLSADGSAHFLTYAAADVLPLLATCAGGEIAEGF